MWLETHFNVEVQIRQPVGVNWLMAKMIINVFANFAKMIIFTKKFSCFIRTWNIDYIHAQKRRQFISPENIR